MRLCPIRVSITTRGHFWVIDWNGNWVVAVVHYHMRLYTYCTYMQPNGRNESTKKLNCHTHMRTAHVIPYPYIPQSVVHSLVRFHSAPFVLFHSHHISHSSQPRHAIIIICYYQRGGSYLFAFRMNCPPPFHFYLLYYFIFLFILYFVLLCCILCGCRIGRSWIRFEGRWFVCLPYAPICVCVCTATTPILSYDPLHTPPHSILR